MSIAFLALIAGFIFGKSTSDRHHSREYNRNQNGILNGSFKNERDIKKIENELKEIAEEKFLTSFKANYSDQYFQINSEIKENFKTCIDSTTYDVSQEDFEEFLVRILRDHFESFVKCADKLKKFLKNI